jgi:hypothetical protein
MHAFPLDAMRMASTAQARGGFHVSDDWLPS